MNTATQLFFKDAPFRVFKLLDDYRSAEKIRLKTGINTPHTFMLIRKFEKMGMIGIIKKGRRLYVTLTEDGEELLNDLKIIENKLKKLKVIEDGAGNSL